MLLSPSCLVFSTCVNVFAGTVKHLPWTSIIQTADNNHIISHITCYLIYGRGFLLCTCLTVIACTFANWQQFTLIWAVNDNDIVDPSRSEYGVEWLMASKHDGPSSVVFLTVMMGGLFSLSSLLTLKKMWPSWLSVTVMLGGLRSLSSLLTLMMMLSSWLSVMGWLVEANWPVLYGELRVSGVQ